jgi:hypothetical protein
VAKRPANACQWLTLHDALRAFVNPDGIHQSQEHIRPLHWHVACRLVIEGGFRPEPCAQRVDEWHSRVQSSPFVHGACTAVMAKANKGDVV